jgi:NAD+ kinase
MSEELSGIKYDCEYLPNDELAKASDVIVVFGGDGTVLRIAKDCARHDCGIFAVNLGNIGFLTEIESARLEKAIISICKNQIKNEYRSLLEIYFKGKSYTALNEVVISRGSRTKMVYLDLMVNDLLVNRVRADGLIVSSPTGSTAYSLSAGGPIVAPDVDAFIITPVCPHSFYSRPFVINNKSTVKIYLLRADPCAYLNVDGEEEEIMGIGDMVEIKKSALDAKFIRLKSYNFYSNIIQKMDTWKRER